MLLTPACLPRQFNLVLIFPTSFLLSGYLVDGPQRIVRFDLIHDGVLADN